MGMMGIPRSGVFVFGGLLSGERGFDGFGGFVEDLDLEAGRFPRSGAA